MVRRKRRKINLGLFFLLVEILLIFALPLFLGQDPYSVDKLYFGTAPGLGGHILGTDSIGRDVLLRLLYGGRVSIFVGLFSTCISMAIGVPLGIGAAYYKGLVEAIVLYVTDVFMAFPGVVLVLVTVALIGPSLWSVSLVIGILGFTGFTRLSYSSAISVSQMGYIASARVLGLKDREILWSYIFPNSFPPILIYAAYQMSSAILTESALSFLGMGVQPPQASWGNILFEAQSIAILIGKPWQWVPAGIAIILTVMSINFLGDNLRDSLDPKTRKRMSLF